MNFVDENDEVLLSGFGRKGKAKGDIPGVRFKVVKVSGVGLSRGDETVTAVTARALARHTGRPVAWRACGLSGATVRDALQRLVPSIAPEPADLMIVAFGVNDATSYRSPSAFADDLTELVTAARNRVGDAAVVIGGGSLRGGEGSVLGAILGTLLMGVLRNGCQLLKYPTSLQSIIIGCIIVAAVAFDEMRHRNRRQ